MQPVFDKAARDAYVAEVFGTPLDDAFVENGVRFVVLNSRSPRKRPGSTPSPTSTGICRVYCAALSSGPASEMKAAPPDGRPCADRRRQDPSRAHRSRGSGRMGLGGGGTGPFACGQGLECQPTEACKGRWPGVCGGDPPGPGGCGPSCQATLCGDGTFCICLSFECVALPPDCRDCACALDAVPEWEKGACTGEEVDGAPPLECMGA